MKKISQKKISTPAGVLCKDFPPEFAEFIVYCRSLRFTAAPDYNLWKDKFRQLLEKLGFEHDGFFDWMTGAVAKEIPKSLADPAAIKPRITMNGALLNSVLPSAQKTDKMQQLMEAYETMEAERDRYKRRCEEKDAMIQKQKREMQAMKRHILLHSRVPYPSVTSPSPAPSSPNPPPSSEPPALVRSNGPLPGRRITQFPAINPGSGSVSCSSINNSHIGGSNDLAKLDRKRRAEAGTSQPRSKTDPLLVTD